MNFFDEFPQANLSDTQTKYLIETLKQQNEDLQQRLNISEKIRNDIQQTLKKSNDQDQYIRLQQANKYKEQLNSINSEKTSIELELKTANSTIEALNNKILFIENSKKAQDEKILEVSLQCFKKSFTTIEDLLNFMLVQPKYYDEELAKNKNVQAKLMKQIKKEKQKQKNIEIQLNKNEISFDKQLSEYKQKINDLQKVIKELKNQIDTNANEADKTIISLQSKIATTRKPKLFFYREPSISIRGNPPNPTLIESLQEKLKITNVYLKDFKNKNKKLEKKVSELTNQIQIEKESKEKVEIELKTSIIVREEAEKQLQTIRDTFESNKDDRNELKLKIRQQKQLINSQVDNIQTLNKTIKKLESKLSELNVQISRIKCEEKSKDNKYDFDSYEPTIRQNQICHSNFDKFISCNMSYTECYTPEIPSLIEPQIKSIIVNRSLQPASKIKMILKAICSYYEDQINNLNQDKVNIQGQLNKYISCFSEFIPKLTGLVLNSHASVNNFIEDLTIQNRTLAILRRKCENANEFPCIKTEAINLTEETEKLERKTKKYKKEILCLKNNIEVLTNSNNEKSSTILELQAQLKYIQRKYNEAQTIADKQKKEFLYKLENSKNQTELEYEKIISVLKRKYNDQQNTINSLTTQLTLHSS